jgi:hypothetical protein
MLYFQEIPGYTSNDLPRRIIFVGYWLFSFTSPARTYCVSRDHGDPRISYGSAMGSSLEYLQQYVQYSQLMTGKMEIDLLTGVLTNHTTFGGLRNKV